MNFGFVPDSPGAWWPETIALLSSALERGGGDQVDLEASLASGNATLWLAAADTPVAALVCRRDGNIMEVWLAGGAVLSGCVPFLVQVENEATQYGMTTGRITGRKGWARVLKPWGWRVDGEDLVKDLTHGQE